MSMLQAEVPDFTSIQQALTTRSYIPTPQVPPIYADDLQGRRYVPHHSNVRTSHRQHTLPTGHIAGQLPEDPEIIRLRRQAQDYLAQVHWVAYLTHNESLRNLLEREREHPTGPFMEQTLHLDVLDLSSGQVQKLRTVKQLKDSFSQLLSNHKQEVTSRVYFLSVDDTSVQTLGLIGSFLNIRQDVFALHMVTHPPLHFSLPSSLDTKSSLVFEYMSLYEGVVSTQKMTFCVPRKDKDIWTGVVLLKNDKIDDKAYRSLQFYVRQVDNSPVKDVSLSSAFIKSISRASWRNQHSDHQIKSILEAAYSIVISECIAALDYLKMELEQNKLALREAQNENLRPPVRLRILNDATPRPKSFYDNQMPYLHEVMYTFDESAEFLDRLKKQPESEEQRSSENQYHQRQQQQQQQQEWRQRQSQSMSQTAVQEEEEKRSSENQDHQRQQQQQQQQRQSRSNQSQNDRIRESFRSDFQYIMWKTNDLREDNDRFLKLRAEVIDPLLPPTKSTKPSARFLQNRLDQIAFGTNPLLSLTFIATVYGMNLDVFVGVSGGLVSLKKYLITGFVFVVCVFCLTFFYGSILRRMANLVAMCLPAKTSAVTRRKFSSKIESTVINVD